MKVMRVLRRVARGLGIKGPDRIDILERYLPRNGVGAEVGVHLGDFSERLLSRLAPNELHLIDPWRYEGDKTYSEAWYGGKAKGQGEMDERYEGVINRFAAEISSGSVKVHRMNSDEALSGFPDGYLDWIYIDGNHLYEYVKRDIDLSLRKVCPGGVVSGDDYAGGGWWEGGVEKAVDEIAASEAAELLGIHGTQFIFRAC